MVAARRGAEPAALRDDRGEVRCDGRERIRAPVALLDAVAERRAVDRQRPDLAGGDRAGAGDRAAERDGERAVEGVDGAAALKVAQRAGVRREGRAGDRHQVSPPTVVLATALKRPVGSPLIVAAMPEATSPAVRPRNASASSGLTPWLIREKWRPCLTESSIALTRMMRILFQSSSVRPVKTRSMLVVQVGRRRAGTASGRHRGR